MTEAKKIKPGLIMTAIALYFTYFIHGIGVSILAQYKTEFATAWGGNLGAVLQVSSALGLGRLITLPFSGPISDRFGRRVSGLIGVALYAAYFVGIATSSSVRIAYLFGILGGAANSFLDTCVTPSILEIFTEKGDIANMFTKFSISIGQFILPFAIGIVASNNMSYTTLFYVAAVLIAIDGILIAFLPFPKREEVAEKEEEGKMKFDATSIALILIGFTCTATFQLWLNCNQELGILYGMSDPSVIQSLYALGTVCAILFSSFVMLKKFEPVQVLVIYPVVSVISLIAVYFIRTPMMAKIGGFLLGFSAAGGVLQLAVSTANAMFPANKGKITSIVMIASSVANYVVLNIAGKITDATGDAGPLNVVLLNIGITVVGVILALFVNKKFREMEKDTEVA